MGTCRDCGQWIYWGEIEGSDGETKRVPYSDSAHTTLHWEDCTAQDYVTDAFGHSFRVTRCSKCKRSVYWETTARGKRRPMDVFVLDDNTYQSAGECHFDTCVGSPTGGNWRQEHAERQKKDQEAGQRQREAAQTFDTRRLEPWLKTLSLSWPCSQQDITTAYRRLALVTHPDMGGPGMADGQAFIAVKAAYDQLRKLVPA
jgi:hypothetical protein